MKKKQNIIETIEQPKLTSEELSKLLIELADSKYWPAIMTYYNNLETVAVRSLRSIDPFKEPTVMARSQGFISALPYLSDFIEQEVEKIKKKNKGEKDDDDKSLGYGN